MIRALLVAMGALVALAFWTSDGWEAVILPVGKKAYILAAERSCIAIGYDYRPIGNRFKFSRRHSGVPDPYWFPGSLDRNPGPKSFFLPIWMVIFWLGYLILRALRKRRA